jgi:hypothetical protein
MSARLAGLALLAAALAGCAGGGGRPAPARPSPAAAATARTGSSVAPPQVMAAAGLEGVIGSPAAALARRFGEPRIDLAEGDARKLQYAGRACVLDIYLYPLAPGAEPTATHVEARIRQGGDPADPRACIREIERR